MTNNEWLTLTLGDIITLQRGFDLPTSARSKDGTVPIVSSAGVSGFHDRAKVLGPGVVTGRYGSVGEVFFVTEAFWPLNTTLFVVDFKGNLPHFVYYLLQTLDYKKHSDKTGVPGVNRNDLHRMTVTRPPLAEQRRIADILSAWDRAIDLTAQLIAAKQQRKRGLMQQLLTGQRRFMAFEGDGWVRKKLDQVFTRVTRKNVVANKNVLTASGQRGLVSQLEYFNRSVAGAALENYYLLKRGEFAYNRSSSEGYPFGAIKRLEDYDAGILSTLYLCFRLADEECNGTFYKHFFEAGGLNLGIYSIAQEGARNHGLLNVGIDEFFSLDVPVPPPLEQKRLADFFDVVDRDINLTIQKRELLKQQKQGLMQQLLTGRVRVTTGVA